uniref:Uncharacterized protein n=1 Tax=Arundo donax TaxID=35708 RepID=A0A0A9B0N4_ARUDO
MQLRNLNNADIKLHLDNQITSANRNLLWANF